MSPAVALVESLPYMHVTEWNIHSGRTRINCSLPTLIIFLNPWMQLRHPNQLIMSLPWRPSNQWVIFPQYETQKMHDVIGRPAVTSVTAWGFLNMLEVPSGRSVERHSGWTSFETLSNRNRTFESDHLMNGVDALFTSNNNKVSADTPSIIWTIMQLKLPSFTRNGKISWRFIWLNSLYDGRKQNVPCRLSWSHLSSLTWTQTSWYHCVTGSSIEVSLNNKLPCDKKLA